MEDVTVLKPLYGIVSTLWHKIPALCDHIGTVISSIKQCQYVLPLKKKGKKKKKKKWKILNFSLFFIKK